MGTALQVCRVLLTVPERGGAPLGSARRAPEQGDPDLVAVIDTAPMVKVVADSSEAGAREGAIS